MFRKLLKGVLLTAAMVMAGAAWAKLPPPPVNQNLGIPDGTFKDMTFQTCLGCHGDPANAPAPVKLGYLPDRHHLRVDTPIGDFSDSPFPGSSPDGTHKCVTCHEIDVIADPTHPDGQYFKFALEPTDPQFRNCLNCHQQEMGADGSLKASVHHLTGKARKKQCYLCHGSMVNDASKWDSGVEHRIPNPGSADNARRCGVATPEGDRNFYDISIVTPWSGVDIISVDPENPDGLKNRIMNFFSDCPDYGARYYDPAVLDGQFNIDPPKYRYEADAAGNIQAILVPDGEVGGRRTGNCAHCHSSGINPGDAVQPNTGTPHQNVGVNQDNHHNATGVGKTVCRNDEKDENGNCRPGTGYTIECGLCHAANEPVSDFNALYTFRGCEVCHGISTLHAIEFDADGDGIIPFQEKPFLGHIGNDLNCRGCHLTFRSGQVYQASTSYLDSSGFKFPGAASSVSDINPVGAIEGVATEVSIVGRSLQGPSTRLELVGTDGKVTEIAMVENDYTTAKAIIPADLPADNYELYVTRGIGENALRSPAINFLVTKGVNVDQVSCSDGKVTITGSGFGSTYVDGTSSLGVSGDGSSCSIDSWSDTRIVANCGAGTGNVTIEGLFGEASADSACGGADEAGRPKWWSIWSWWSSWSWSRR